MRVVNFSDVRNRLKNVLDQVVNDVDYTIISRRIDDTNRLVYVVDESGLTIISCRYYYSK